MQALKDFLNSGAVSKLAGILAVGCGGAAGYLSSQNKAPGAVLILGCIGAALGAIALSANPSKPPPGSP